MNRIFFPGNPWPKGHRIKEFVWSGRIDPEEVIRFDLHLRTEPYDFEEEGIKLEEGRDWTSRGVWLNYHSCILSSTYWDHDAFVAATPENPFDFASTIDRVYRVDTPPPKSRVKRAFGIYLTGYDGVADHKIVFNSNTSKSWTLDWKGCIALEYAGRYTFDYEFYVSYLDADFSGCRLNDSMSEKKAARILKDCLKNREFRPTEVDGHLWFV